MEQTKRSGLFLFVMCLLCFFGIIGVLITRHGVISPVPDEGAIRVIYLTPTPAGGISITPISTPKP
jgi:hypothetical protein